jgi:hypothetical protein
MPLNPELRVYNLGAILNSFEPHCQSFHSFGSSKAPGRVAPLIGSARPIITFNSLSLLFWNHNIPCLHMAMSDFKDNHCNPSELLHGPSFLVFAAKSWVSSD